MEKLDFSKIDDLLRLPKHVTISMFDQYVNNFLEKKANKELAIHELDSLLALLQNHITSFSLLIKRNFVLQALPTLKTESVEYYTKQELANKYRVSVRTVTNWIIDGLEIEEIGGIKRISLDAVEKFRTSVKGKKFHWKSPAKKVLKT
jgi:hypothetical protein